MGLDIKETGDIQITSFPSLGTIAPDFTAETTLGDIRLSELKGRWVILFSYPGDFTPV